MKYGKYLTPLSEVRKGPHRQRAQVGATPNAQNASNSLGKTSSSQRLYLILKQQKT